jgi:decaprenylphospho-beta-D-ribofuranose 2-oxidase
MAATIGGMGLTGVILWARIKLRRLRSAAVSVDTDRAESLDELLTLLEGPGGSHRVAWLDLLSARPVRGVVTRAEQLIEDPPAARRPPRTTVPARLRIPAYWPGGALRRPVLQAFNELRFRRTPRRQVGHVESFGAHMFPLDGLDDWFRLYGPSGFVQYQLAVPRGEERALEAVIARLRRSPIPCYLAVLKDFGPENHAPLSFPMMGWTLTMDMPRAAPGLERLQRDFDELVAGAGGRVYLAKDGRLRPDALAAMYPRLGEWRAIRDQADPERHWRSDLALRTGLVAP